MLRRNVHLQSTSEKLDELFGQPFLLDYFQQKPASTLPSSALSAASSSCVFTSADLYTLFERYLSRVLPLSSPLLGTSFVRTSSPPFVLRQVKSNGLECSVCREDVRCSGCIIAEDSSSPLVLNDRQVIAVDISAESNLVYDPIAESRYIDHPIAAASAAVTLVDCFRLFTTAERLSKADSWYCSRCKKHVPASKKLELWRLPSLLVVHLKRFEKSFVPSLAHKLSTFVEFPLQNLDLSVSLPEFHRTNLPKYDLFAVINHFGNAHIGHYTAFGRHPLPRNQQILDSLTHAHIPCSTSSSSSSCSSSVASSTPASMTASSSSSAPLLSNDSEPFFQFDDEHVSLVENSSSVVTPDAYILFYRRRS